MYKHTHILGQPTGQAKDSEPHCVRHSPKHSVIQLELLLAPINLMRKFLVRVK
jgi:hypothetical protein